MAFQHPAALPRQTTFNTPLSRETTSEAAPLPTSRVEESQEWILFSPSQAESSTNQTQTTRTAGLSRVSDLGSLNTAARSGRLDSSVLEEEAAEDAELDSLDEGLHAFREPPLYQTNSNQHIGPVLPAHDGLGTFPASSRNVQDQLWQHEQYNPKRKFEGHHRRPSSIQRRLDTIEERESQANEDKRIRIEQWRLEQSQALLEEVEKETRRKIKRQSSRQNLMDDTLTRQVEDILGTTPKQSDYFASRDEDNNDSEPFWRRITRRFIRDIIGIDEPLLSVILGESLPEEVNDRPASSTSLPPIPEHTPNDLEAVTTARENWRDRLLQRIARELGVFVHQIAPHPGAFSTYNSASQQYAGIPINQPAVYARERPQITKAAEKEVTQASAVTPNFTPTVQDPTHEANWGLDDEQNGSSSATHMESSDTLRREREYWERELDIKMVFRYLRNRFSSGSAVQEQPDALSNSQEAAQRAAIIRQHHPLVARAHRSPVRTRRDSRLLARRPSSSCASESVKSSRKASLVRSGSSRNYWDLGGSVGSGSILASGGLMGGWGEV